MVGSLGRKVCSFRNSPNQTLQNFARNAKTSTRTKMQKQNPLFPHVTPIGPTTPQEEKSRPLAHQLVPRAALSKTPPSQTHRSIMQCNFKTSNLTDKNSVLFLNRPPSTAVTFPSISRVSPSALPPKSMDHDRRFQLRNAGDRPRSAAGGFARGVIGRARAEG